jgi:hypothetical protein
MKMPYSRTGGEVEMESEGGSGRAASAILAIHSRQLASERRLLRNVMSLRCRVNAGR